MLSKIVLPCLLLCVLADARLLPKFSSFSKVLQYPEKRIILSSNADIVTENDSFLYAICDSQEKTFKENKCNVTVETPAFANASYKEMCIVKLAPADSKRESLTKLSLYPFRDDKVLLTWTVKDLDWHTKTVQVRILYMSSCKFYDVPVLADKLLGIVPYDNNFDLFVQAFDNKGFCGSNYCKVTYNAEGKKTNGPTPFLPGAKLGHVAGVAAAAPRSPMKGFYALAYSGNETENLRVFQASTDGKGGELIKTGSPNNVKLSNAHDLFSVCWTSESTNVTCKQYDAKMGVKFSAVFEFLDNDGGKRWIRQQNLLDGGLLLLTGTSTGKDNRRFERFSVIKINPNGLRERPLEVEDLDFECLSSSDLRVNIAEQDNDEYCFHFVCERSYFNKWGIWNELKFETKCLPRRQVSIAKHLPSLVN